MPCELPTASSEDDIYCLLTSQIIWPGLFERYGGRLAYEFDLSTLAHITHGYSSGKLDMVVRAILSERRKDTMKKAPPSIQEIIQWISRVEPMTPDVDNALRKWTDKTPAMAALKAAEAAPLVAADTGKKDAKKK